MNPPARLLVLVVCAAVVVLLGFGVGCSQRIALHLEQLADVVVRFLDVGGAVALGLSYRSQSSTTAAHIPEPAVVQADVAVVRTDEPPVRP